MSFLHVPLHRWALGLALWTLTHCCHVPEESETRPAGVNVLDRETLAEARRGRVDFSRHVKPLLEAKCVACHNQDALPGHMSLASREEALRTRALGGYIVPGQPDRSLLIANLQSVHAAVKVMPAVGETLTSEEVALLRRWIAQGAPWPDGAAGRLHIAER